MPWGPCSGQTLEYFNLYKIQAIYITKSQYAAINRPDEMPGNGFEKPKNCYYFCCCYLSGITGVK
jgi:hypothetical protein